MDETLKQLLEEIRNDIRRIEDIRDDIKRIEIKVDKGFHNINNRVRKLENWRSALVGAWILFGFLVALIVKILF